MVIIEELIKIFSDSLLFIACLFILFGSIFLTIRTRFIQIRFLPTLFKMFKASLEKQKEEEHTILPHKALMTAMSTTLGISTIVAPVIAISLGGPGALIGFLLTAFFGSAATYIEVTLSLQYRKKLETGKIRGGPMEYLRHLLSPGFAKWYALGTLILMTVWSGAQANQLSAILDSPLLGTFRIPKLISGAFLALVVSLTLIGGIKRISTFSSKLVPVMFFLYIGSSLWILACNLDQMPRIFGEIVASLAAPREMANGVVIGGLVSALRWGIFKGTQTSEAGVGTQAIPHAMAETHDPAAQGTLAMLSTYTAGFVAFLSGCVCLVTKTWLDPTLPLGISMVAASFKLYFSFFGIAIVAISTLLFGFGTILGNSYNGLQCFGYLTKDKKMLYYFIATAVMIFLGAIAEVKMVWSLIDLVLVFIAVPHMLALILHVYKKPIVTAENTRFF